MALTGHVIGLQAERSVVVAMVSATSRGLLAAWLMLATLMAAGCGRSDAIVVIALHPTNPKILYVATNDYIYKTRDGGRTWDNLSRGMSHSRVISVAIDPVYPATVYAGTKGDAVYKSYDGGQRWVSLRQGLDSVDVSSVVNQFVFDPGDSRRIFAATTMGVFETGNGGETWEKRMEGMKEVLMVITLAMDPRHPMTLYAGTSGGVYKTVNRATRWDRVSTGLIPPEVKSSSRALGVTVVQVDPHAADVVYAATLNGLYKSMDGAASWTRIGAELPDQMISAMVLDRAKPGVIHVASRQGIHRSRDSGHTWAPSHQGLASSNVRSLAQSPVNPDVFYAGTNGSGLYRSLDGGETWERMPFDPQ
jgi:photosystem II stability/assembly factor-like uncharacterized protein